MNEQTTENLHRRYDLAQERKYPSKKVPASHQSEALDKLHHWFRANNSPSGGILVLPTGGGKTFVAVRFLCSGPLSQGYKVLWLAHTHHLLEQAFYSFASPNQGQGYHAGNEVGRITEPKPTLNVRVVSGTPGHFPVHQIKPDDDVIIATLQTITRAYNDSKQTALRNFLASSQGQLFVVFDEAHHAVGDYAYVFVSEMYQKQREKRLILGITASPGNDVTKILEVCKNLDITNIEIRTKSDPDVKPYVHDLKIFWKEIPLPHDFAHTIQLLRQALSERLKILKNIEINISICHFSLLCLVENLIFV